MTERAVPSGPVPSGPVPAGPVCGKCGAPLDPGRVAAQAAGGRIEFRESCGKCGAYLHCCLNCAHHDPKVHHECRASATTEYVPDKEKGNFCEEFRYAPRPGTSPRVKSRAEIEKLFGDGKG